jgi:hypothetical protein
LFFYVIVKLKKTAKKQNCSPKLGERQRVTMEKTRFWVIQRVFIIFVNKKKEKPQNNIISPK